MRKLSLLITVGSALAGFGTPALAVPVPEPEIDTRCAPGSYSATGEKPCIAASPGHYVPTYAAVTQIAAAPGYFVAESGATAQTPAPAGYYQPYPASTGVFAAPPGYFVPTTAATNAFAAPPGTYVSGEAATAPTVTPAGSYTNQYASTSPILASPGYYVPSEGQTGQFAAPAGHYAAGNGNTSYTAAPPGYYAPTAGMAGPIAAPPGTYAPNSAMISTIPAPPGYYAPNPGMAAPFAAPAGYYVPGHGFAAPIAAPAGTYVAEAAAIAPTAAPRGFYVASAGQTAPTAAPAGYYVPAEGQALPTPCSGGFSYGGASACRSGGGEGAGLVSPAFSLIDTGEEVGFGDVALGTSQSLSFFVRNNAFTNEVGSFLTDLTLLGFSFSGDSDGFTLDGFSIGEVLGEGAMRQLTLRFTPTRLGAFSALLNITTDQFASFGTPGQIFTLDLSGNGVTGSSVVPEPANWMMLIAGFGVVGVAVRRRRAKTLPCTGGAC
jgi:hypothetical protein